MEDQAGRQVKAGGDLRVARFAPAKPTAGREEARPRRPVDSAVDAAAAEQARVGSVDDRVDGEARDVAFDDLDCRAARPQAWAGCLQAMPLSVRWLVSSPLWNISRTISQPPTNSPLM